MLTTQQLKLIRQQLASNKSRDENAFVTKDEFLEIVDTAIKMSEIDDENRAAASV